jgi:hypothetical protein
MAKTSGIDKRMADFYFKLEGPNGEVQTFESSSAQADEEEMEEEE